MRFNQLLQPNLRLFFLHLFIYGVNHLTMGQTQDHLTFYVDQFNTQEGLRQSMVKQVFQDNRGVVWLLTGDGLHYYDGSEFKVFRVPSTAPYSQHDNVMRNCVQPDTTSLLIATASSILRFDIQKATFKIILKDLGLHPVLLAFEPGFKPLIWSKKAGYLYFASDSLFPFPMDTETPNEIFTEHIPIDAFQVNDSLFFIFCQDGFYRCRADIKNNKYQFKAAWHPLNELCTAVAFDGSQQIFIAKRNQIEIITPNTEVKKTIILPITAINNIYIDFNKNVWLSEPNQKYLYQLSDNKLKKADLLRFDGRHTDTIAPFIVKMSEDNQHNLWIGTDGDGVLQYQTQKLFFEKSMLGFVKCITTHNNKIVSGTFENGIWESNYNLTDTKRIFERVISAKANILAVWFDNFDRAWILQPDGLTVFENEKAIFNYPMTINVARFFKVYDDTLFVSTNNHLFAFSLDQTPEFIYKKSQYHFTDLLEINDFYWIGTAYGIFRVAKHKGFSLSECCDKNKISSSEIKSLEFFGNQIWAATQNGIEVFDKNGQLSTHSYFNGLLNDELLYCLIYDGTGNLWFSSNNGIGCIDTLTRNVQYFDLQHNLQSSEFNSKAFYKTDSTYIYFGGIYGINAINTRAFQKNTFVKKPLLTELYIADTLYCKGIPMQNQHFLLDWKNASINGKIFSADYSEPGDQTYSFYLENYDKTWSNPTKNRVFQYKNITPGYYALFVKYGNTSNIWSAPVQLLSVYIPPPFWKTWWFFPLMLILSVLLIGLIVKRRQQIKYQRTIDELERKNALQNERLRISRDLHDELGAGLSLILLNSTYIGDKTDQTQSIVSSMQKINRNTRELYDSMNNLIWLLKNEHQTLESLLSKIRETISDICDEAGIDYQLHFPDENTEILLNRDICRQLFFIHKETVNNMLKHAQATSLNEDFRIENSQIFFKISDNGKGFNPEQLTKKGNGIENMKNRMKQLNGTFTIISETGTGTTIECRLPVKGAL